MYLVEAASSSVTQASGSSLPPPTKKFALLSYKRPAATTTTTTDSPEAILVKYVTAINMDDFDADEPPNVFAAKEYRVLKRLFCRLRCVPATSAPLSAFFQGGLIMRPNRARVGERCSA